MSAVEQMFVAGQLGSTDIVVRFDRDEQIKRAFRLRYFDVRIA
jgi:hypothetical protein